MWHQEMKWNAQGKGISYRALYFTSQRCIEKCMVGFRIDDHIIRMGKFVCILVI
jgi:hypothetical protein